MVKAGSAPAFTMPDTVADGAQLWLIRHGETEWSRDGQHTGRTELPLTEHGEQEAQALAPLLAVFVRRSCSAALETGPQNRRARRTARRRDRSTTSPSGTTATMRAYHDQIRRADSGLDDLHRTACPAERPLPRSACAPIARCVRAST